MRAKGEEERFSEERFDVSSRLRAFPAIFGRAHLLLPQCEEPGWVEGVSGFRTRGSERKPTNERAPVAGSRSSVSKKTLSEASAERAAVTVAHQFLLTVANFLPSAGSCLLMSGLSKMGWRYIQLRWTCGGAVS